MKKLPFLLLVFVCTIQLAAQNKVEKALQTLSEKYPQEKIYLQYTKGSYIAGDQIWFKAYVFEGYNRSAISTSLHLVLYNDKKQIISRKFIPLFQGEGKGDFILSDSLPEGVYYIRAYTQWMLNFSESFQYIHSFPVYNPASPKKLVADTLAAWKANAFAEGGFLIEGVNSRIAVRLRSDGVLPQKWTGYVIDSGKPAEKISTFNSLDKNIGFFFLVPEKNKKYQVVIEDDRKRKQTIDLPEVKTTGISLQVNGNKGQVHYSMRYKSEPQTAISCTIVGTMNNIMVYKAQAKIDAQGVAANIPTEILINGILQLTILDTAGTVLAKRLCFVEPTELKINEPSFSRIYFNKNPRDLNTFEVLKDTSSIYYDVLVLDGSAPNYLAENNILTSFWLSSDLTGKIDNPARYLGYDGDAIALDALLISEEWQRFRWEDIIAGKFPDIKYKPSPYISYRGTAFGKGSIAANAELNLIFKYSDSSSAFSQVKTDSRGNFELSNLGFEDAVKVYYQLNNKNAVARDLKVSFESLNNTADYQSPLPASGYTMVARNPKDVLRPDIARAVQARDNFKMSEIKIKDLEEIKIIAKKKSPSEELNEKLTSPMFRSMNETVLDFVNDNKGAFGYSNIIQYLQGRVAGLQVENRNGNFVPIIRGSVAAIYLNEMQVDASMVSTIPVSDVALVKVLKSGFVGGSSGGGTAIAIYTRRGDTKAANENEATASLNNSILNGFDRTVAFSFPDYKDPSMRPIQKDTRDVLYWEPNLEVDAAKTIPIKFFNNDDAKNIRVIIIGFSKDDDTPLFYNEIIK